MTVLKGWVLVSLYTEKHPQNPEKPVYVSFAHYTGRDGPHGGLEYDKVLRGHLSYDEFRQALRRHLVLGPGNKRQCIPQQGGGTENEIPQM